MTPEKAAVLFDVLGEVDWFVVNRATTVRLLIKQLEAPVAQRLRATYHGSIGRRSTLGQSIWYVSGRDSELFTQAILPHVQPKTKELLQFYLAMRERIINSSGRGRASTLNDDDLALRKEIEREFARMQGKEVEV